MVRRLSPEEAALWRKVVESVRPLSGKPPKKDELERKVPSKIAPPLTAVKVAASAPKVASRPPGPGMTLDGSWDRRLAGGLVQPDLRLDLHGHNLATAYDLLDRKLEQAVSSRSRVLLLITGKAPSAESSKRGAIRAAVGDWLAASRHASEIAAVRNAHPRHGGSGALYIILRRARQKPIG